MCPCSGPPCGENQTSGYAHDNDHIVQAHPGDVHQVDGENLVADLEAPARVHATRHQVRSLSHLHTFAFSHLTGGGEPFVSTYVVPETTDYGDRSRMEVNPRDGPQPLKKPFTVGE